MKRILGFVAALLLALSLPMTVFAESKETPESNQGYAIKLRDKADPNGVKVGDDSAAVRAAWKISAEVLPDGYTVIAVKDAYVVQGDKEVDPSTVNPPYVQELEGIPGTDIILHYGKNGVEKFGSTAKLSTANMSPVIFLSKDETKSQETPAPSTPSTPSTPSKTDNGAKKATNTADTSNMFVYGGLLVVALGAIAAVVTAKKRNA